MNIYPILSSTSSLFTNKISISLTPLQKKVALVVALVLCLLAAVYLLGKMFCNRYKIIRDSSVPDEIKQAPQEDDKSSDYVSGPVNQEPKLKDGDNDALVSGRAPPEEQESSVESNISVPKTYKAKKTIGSYLEEGEFLLTGELYKGKRTDKFGCVQEGFFTGSYYNEDKASVEGYLTGEGTITPSSMRFDVPKEKGNYEYGVLHGKGTRTYQDGTEEIGDYCNGSFVQGTKTYRDENDEMVIEEGQFVEEQTLDGPRTVLDGEGTRTSKKGIEKGFFERGMLRMEYE